MNNMNDFDRILPSRYNPQFSEIAVEEGFATPKQLRKAMLEQLRDDLANRSSRHIGRIMIDNGWMTVEQVEMTLNKVCKIIDE